jgi:hemoglobin-like flavoprotein
MTPSEIALVRQGFARIAPDAENVGLAFYQQLFTLDPSLRRLFSNDLRKQAGHLMAALAMVVCSLDDLGPVLARVQALGRRHVSYGVQPHHFTTGGVAFIATLEAGLGEEFTPAACEAWTRAYTTLAGAMIAAMDEATPAAA